MSDVFVNYKIYKKRRNKFSLCLFLLFVMAVSSSFSQTLNAFIKAGDKAFIQKDFYTAAYYYKQALDIDSLNFPIAYRYAESSRMFNDYKEAEHWYAYVISKGNAGDIQTSVFWLAMMKKTTGNYTEAEKLFSKYASDHLNENTYFSKKANLEIAACAYAKKLITEDTIPIRIKNLGPAINSPHADFAGYQANDTLLYFSSLRGKLNLKKVNASDPSALTKIYVAQLKDTVWQTAMPFDIPINEKGQHTANGTFSPNRLQFYFTSCKAIEGSAELQCAIFMSEQKEGKWQQAVRLNDTINKPGFNTTQPAIAANGDMGTILYFASDRAGGQGNLDIWYATISTSGHYGMPVNAGPVINTADDEITPFYEDSTHTLYFSSTWHMGLGGFDIFASKGSMETWTVPQNIGFPLNSGFNDLYYTKYKKRGYFASNRPFEGKTETCCNDIYSYEPVNKSASVKDSILLNDSLNTIRLSNEKSIENLKQKLANLQALIPVTVYFHNDEPDPKTRKNTTKKSYKAYYDNYIALEKEYRTEFAKGLKNKYVKLAQSSVDNFFNSKVRKGYTDLETFTSLVKELVEKGVTVTVSLKGYCSPLTTTAYNVNLARRRISSLRNYFDEYGNGLLKKYIENAAGSGAKIIFIEKEIGETEAAKDVSDDYYDTQNSIYNPKAALERKVQIIGVDFEKAPK